jgi:acetate kinase
MTGCVAVLNAGSSSIKFSLYEAGRDGALLFRGQVENIGLAAHLAAADPSGAVVAERRWGKGELDHRGATAEILKLGRELLAGRRVLAFGHRVVHGGTEFAAPVRVDANIMAALAKLVPLAPLHQPHNLAAIEAVQDLLPGIPQVVCFDTSFHRGQNAVAELVPLPREIRDSGVQRYGFHGLSYEYIASVLPQVAPEIAAGRVIVAHLGSGASLCAMRNGKSLDSTLGFTALDGLCMGTRPGALDPGVVLYLFQGLALSPTEVETILYKKSGLLGISGISNDMRDLLGSHEPGARLAVDYFVYRAAKEIGALAAVLGGIDGLVFTAGIGENSPEVRRRIGEASAWLGIEMDAKANEGKGPRISKAGSRVSAWVIPTNEELMIARHTGRLLGLVASTAQK